MRVRFMRSIALYGRKEPIDPRYFQITALLLLYAISLFVYDFVLDPMAVPASMGAALLGQYLNNRILRVPFDWRSPTITALSVVLLLRATAPFWFALCSFLAIGSKLFIRRNGRHVFNPSNVAIVLLLTAGAPVWLSPGQWGQGGWVVGLVLVLGALVLRRTGRIEIALAFLGTYAAGLLLRASWLGDPIAIPLHQMQTVSLLVFSAFMITDPRVTPVRRAARIAFAFGVAVLALSLQIKMQLVGSPIYALAILSPFTLILDRMCPGPKFKWHNNREICDATHA